MRVARRPAELGLDGQDRRYLRRALRTIRDLRTYRRVQAILWTAEGRRLPEVARWCGRSRRAVYDWLVRYRRHHRVQDLIDSPRPGRPAAAPALSAARIAREFGKDPLKLGYRCTVWTVPLLAGHLSRRYGCAIGPRTLRRRMEAMGLAWKRPRHAYRDKAQHLPQKKGALCGGCGA
jgi:transposase